jgi:hypothetical protein
VKRPRAIPAGEYQPPPIGTVWPWPPMIDAAAIALARFDGLSFRRLGRVQREQYETRARLALEAGRNAGGAMP